MSEIAFTLYALREYDAYIRRGILIDSAEILTLYMKTSE